MAPRSSQNPRLGCAFYRTAGGNEPVRDWLPALGKEVSKTVGSDILATQWGWPLGKPLVDGLGGGLYEIRSSHAHTEYRVFFCIAASTIVLPHGVLKKTQKTRRADLELARSRLKEVVER